MVVFLIILFWTIGFLAFSKHQSLKIPFGEDSNLPGWTGEERRDSRHFLNSLDSFVKAGKYFPSESAEPGVEMEEKLEQAYSHLKSALDEALKVRDIFLDKAHPQLKKHFREEYIQGLQMMIRKREMNAPDSAELINSSPLLRAWKKWIAVNMADIRMP